jgi:hypothetical protein
MSPLPARSGRPRRSHFSHGVAGAAVCSQTLRVGLHLFHFVHWEVLGEESEKSEACSKESLTTSPPLGPSGESEGLLGTSGIAVGGGDAGRLRRAAVPRVLVWCMAKCDSRSLFHRGRRAVRAR